MSIFKKCVGMTNGKLRLLGFFGGGLLGRVHRGLCTCSHSPRGGGAGVRKEGTQGNGSPDPSPGLPHAHPSQTGGVGEASEQQWGLQAVSCGSRSPAVAAFNLPHCRA